MALKAEKIFDLMTEHLKSNKDAIKKVGGVLHFEISLKKLNPSKFFFFASEIFFPPPIAKLVLFYIIERT